MNFFWLDDQLSRSNGKHIELIIIPISNTSGPTRSQAPSVETINPVKPLSKAAPSPLLALPLSTFPETDKRKKVCLESNAALSLPGHFIPGPKW